MPSIPPLSRRTFLKSAAGAVALGSSVVLAGLESCQNPDMGVGPSPLTGRKVTLTLANEPNLQSVGGFIRRTFGSNNGGNEVLVVHVTATGSGAFRTMSVVCTHAGCPVNNPAGGEVFCGCHGSTFGAQAGDFASNLSGPAPSPLQTFQTTFDGSTITIAF
jgi:Rieske Fe-S protein